MAPRPVALKIVRVLLAVAGPLPGLASLPAMAADFSPAAGAQEPAGQERAEAADDASGEEVPAAADTPLPAAAPEPGEGASQPQESPWAGTLELYGFAPLRTTIDARFPGISASDELSLGTLLEHLTDIGYVRGSIEYGRIGLLTDLSYVGVGAQSARSAEGSLLRERSQQRRRIALGASVNADVEAAANAQVGFRQGIYDLALRYRFGPREKAIEKSGAVTLIPYAGVRLLDVTTDLNVQTRTSVDGQASASVSGRRFSLEREREFSLQREREFSRSLGGPVLQPLIGLQGQVFLSPRLRLFARGDVGGLNLTDAMGTSANAQVGLGYAIGNSSQLNLSWRYLHMARETGGASSRSFTINQNGIEVGVKFFF
jgi:opacity protein-like surface antigen